MRTRLTLVILLLVLSITGWRSSNACLWDYDTLRHEARGMPGVIEAVTGRFDRYPPLYYEMRLERVTKLLGESPDDLDAYDGAGVACDRLGRGDDAIEWMARKDEALGRLESAGHDVSDHRYRHLANLGTFHAHRWVRGGADRADLTDLQRARDLIAAAIELNPDAHFGRERYQLLAIEWLLDPPLIFPDAPTIWYSVSGLEETHAGTWQWGKGHIADAGYADAIEGLTGLIVLGNAWESIDILASLAAALEDEGLASIALVANLRIQELLDQGKTTLYQDPDVEVLSADYDIEVEYRFGTTVHAHKEVEAWYPKARAEAEAWREARTEYIMARLNRGEHPDTHPEFWQAWSEPSSPPPLPGNALGLDHEGVRALTIATTLTGIAILLLAVPSIIIVWLLRRRQSHRMEQPAVV